MKTTTIKNVIELHLLSSKKKTKSVFNATARFRRIFFIVIFILHSRVAFERWDMNNIKASYML